MGCPDYIHVACPKCKEKITFQSKAGKCSCLDFSPDAVPMDIAMDLDGETKDCPHCSAVVKLSIPKTTPSRIRMEVTIGTGEEWD
jgi:phage FluMu protein Com